MSAYLIPVQSNNNFLNYYQKQAQKEEYIPHGCRIVDLDVLRNGLQSCQCCKSGETEKKGLLKL